MRLDGMRRLRHGSANGVVHRVMMMQRRRLGSRRSSQVSLGLHRVRPPIAVYSGHCSASYTGPRLVGWMVEQGTNIVYEKRIELFGNLLLIRELKSTLERDPASRQYCFKQEHEACAYQTPLRCIGPIFTTCRVFSLLRIPSLRPRVMPATLSSFVPLIM